MCVAAHSSWRPKSVSPVDLVRQKTGFQKGNAMGMLNSRLALRQRRQMKLDPLPILVRFVSAARAGI
jgi:hypothetical protein